MRDGREVKSNTVDSSPPEVAPASSTRSIRPARLRSTCSALVGEMVVEAFALGAASGMPASISSASRRDEPAREWPPSGAGGHDVRDRITFRQDQG